MVQILWPRGRRGGQPVWGAAANQTFILGGMPMNVLLGDHRLPDPFRLKIILWVLTPLVFERGESCGWFGVGTSNPDR